MRCGKCHSAIFYTMRLEEAIKQPKFRSEHNKLMLNILYTFNWVEEPIKAVLSDFSLTLPQYNILRILKGSSSKPLSPNEIKEVMLHKKSDLTRLIDRLESKALIYRVVCPSNRRKMDITITKEGLNILDEIYPILNAKTESKLQKHLTLDEAKLANELLDKMRG